MNLKNVQIQTNVPMLNSEGSWEEKAGGGGEGGRRRGELECSKCQLMIQCLNFNSSEIKISTFKWYFQSSNVKMLIPRN